MVLSGRHALIHRDALVLTDAGRLLERLRAQTPGPRLVIYLGSALANSDLPAGTEILLFILSAPAWIRAPRQDSPRAPRGRDSATSPPGWTRPTRPFSSRPAPSPTGMPRHTHCPRCGAPTTVEAGGWVRRCPADNSEHYPRTDPAIIVTVVGPDDRLLLGGGGPAGCQELLNARRFRGAGGVARAGSGPRNPEEVGVRVRACQYLGSQAWPFPASLMLGFTAVTDDPKHSPTAWRSPGRAGSAGRNSRRLCSAARSSFPPALHRPVPDRTLVRRRHPGPAAPTNDRTDATADRSDRHRRSEPAAVKPAAVTVRRREHPIHPID